MSNVPNILLSIENRGHFLFLDTYNDNLQILESVNFIKNQQFYGNLFLKNYKLQIYIYYFFDVTLHNKLY